MAYQKSYLHEQPFSEAVSVNEASGVSEMQSHSPELAVPHEVVAVPVLTSAPNVIGTSTHIVCLTVNVHSLPPVQGEVPLVTTGSPQQTVVASPAIACLLYTSPSPRD